MILFRSCRTSFNHPANSQLTFLEVCSWTNKFDPSDRAAVQRAFHSGSWIILPAVIAILIKGSCTLKGC